MISQMKKNSDETANEKNVKIKIILTGDFLLHGISK